MLREFIKQIISAERTNLCICLGTADVCSDDRRIH
jgi:hypothetical protein